MREAADQIRARNFAYLPLEVMSPTLRHLIDLRPVFGLRSPVHSFSRMLNPFDAPTVMQGIFHRGFMDIHSGAAQLMGMPNMAVFRGEGGEIERRAQQADPGLDHPRRGGAGGRDLAAASARGAPAAG